jgi:hypothetical protein
VVRNAVAHPIKPEQNGAGPGLRWRYQTGSPVVDVVESTVVGERDYLVGMSNERRKARAARRRQADAFEDETRSFNARPLEEIQDAVARDYVLNSESHLHPLRCAGCGGRGSRERRGRSRSDVPCRVCQGTGWIQRRVGDDLILGMRPNKVYWQGRRWWRHWRG